MFPKLLQSIVYRISEEAFLAKSATSSRLCPFEPPRLPTIQITGLYPSLRERCVEERSLVPLGEARLGRIGLDQWLRRRSQARVWNLASANRRMAP